MTTDQQVLHLACNGNLRGEGAGREEEKKEGKNKRIEREGRENEGRMKGTEKEG